MKSTQKGFATTIVLVIVIAGLAGYLVWDKTRGHLAFPTPPLPTFATPTLSSTPPIGTPSENNSKWSTHRDEVNGFEISYPNDGGVYMDYSPTYDSGSGRVFGVNGVGRAHPPFYFSVYALPLRGTEGVPCREAAYSGASKFEFIDTIKISGKDYAKCIITRELQQDQVLSVSFNYKGKTWHFLAQQYNRENVLIDQIISTFKFIPTK